MKHDWEYKTIDDCFHYIKNGANIKQDKQAEGLPITRIETLSNGVFNRDRLGYANVFDKNKYLDYIMEDGDLLMSHINSKQYIGRTVLYNKCGDECIIHGMNLLRLKATLDILMPKYAAIYFQSIKFKSDVAKIRKDAVNQSSMAITDLRKISIPVPPLPTQQSIVSELDSLSKIIADCKETLKDYDALEQSIFYDMFGDPVKNDKGWEVKKLGEVCTKITDGVHSKPKYVESGVPFVSVKDITTGDLIMDDVKYISKEDHIQYSKRCPIEFGDVLYTKVGATYGRPALVNIKDEFSLYVSVALLKPIHKVVNNQFLCKQLSTDFVKRQADSSIKGIGVPDLHLNMIKNFVVLVPPMHLQLSFNEKIEAIEQMKSETKKALQEAETLFQARMDYWFN